MNKKQLHIKRESINPFWSNCIRISSIIFITSLASYLVLWILVLLLNMTARVLNIIATLLAFIIIVSFIIVAITIVLREEIEENLIKKIELKKRVKNV